MASLSSRPPYICRRCIQHFARRPDLRQSTGTTGPWRNYASASSQAAHASEPRSDGATPTSSEPVTDGLSELMAATEPRRGGRVRPTRSSSFRLAKHFNRDAKLQGTPNMRAPNSALEVELDDGNQTGYSRHRQPEEAPRIRPIRRTESTDPFRDARAEKEELSITAPEKRQAYTRLENPELQGCHWYWETVAPTIAQKAQATHFFLDGKPPKFLRSVAIFRAFPESDVPEVAFVGRSNVGKSSLLNAIVNANTKALLAKTSATPGFTKTMNLYGVGPGNGVNIIKDATSGHDKVVGAGGITIVDMPGYGEGSLSEWGYEIMKYLQGRKQLRRVFVLLDAQHGIKDKDRSLLAALRLGGISHQIILSKLDKIYIPKADSIKHVDGKSVSKWKPKGSLKHLQDVMKGIRAEVNPPVGGGALGEILGCSSELLVDKKRLGLDAVRFAILQAADLQLRVKPEKKKDQSRLVRTMKVGRARDALDAL